MKYRIYADNSVVEEPDFPEYDHAQPYSDDYITCALPVDTPFDILGTQAFPDMGSIHAKVLYEHIKEKNLGFLASMSMLSEQP